jgi:branched-chain amino acid aminotransferase
MQANQYLHHNGKIYKADKLLISPNNRSFRYGDGFFETMKMINGKIILADYHFERLFKSLELLQFDKPNYFSADYLKTHIEELAKKKLSYKTCQDKVNDFSWRWWLVRSRKSFSQSPDTNMGTKSFQ